MQSVPHRRKSNGHQSNIGDNLAVCGSDLVSFSDNDSSSSTADSTNDFSSDVSVNDPNFEIESTASDSNTDENLSKCGLSCESSDYLDTLVFNRLTLIG